MQHLGYRIPTCDGRRMVAAARDLANVFATQFFHQARHKLPSIVAVPESTIVAATPSVHFAIIFFFKKEIKIKSVRHKTTRQTVHST